MKPQYISMCRKATEIQERGFPRGAQVVVKPWGHKISRQTTGRIVERDADYKKVRATGQKPPIDGWYMVVVQGVIQRLPKSNLVWIPSTDDLLRLYGRHWREFDAACDVMCHGLSTRKAYEKTEIGLRVVMAGLYGKEWDVKKKEWTRE